MFFCKLNTGVGLDFVELEKPRRGCLWKYGFSTRFLARKVCTCCWSKQNKTFFRKNLWPSPYFLLSVLMRVPDFFYIRICGFVVRIKILEPTMGPKKVFKCIEYLKTKVVTVRDLLLSWNDWLIDEVASVYSVFVGIKLGNPPTFAPTW